MLSGGTGGGVVICTRKYILFYLKKMPQIWFIAVTQMKPFWSVDLKIVLEILSQRIEMQISFSRGSTRSHRTTRSGSAKSKYNFIVCAVSSYFDWYYDYFDQLVSWTIPITIKNMRLSLFLQILYNSISFIQPFDKISFSISCQIPYKILPHVQFHRISWSTDTGLSCQCWTAGTGH